MADETLCPACFRAPCTCNYDPDEPISGNVLPVGTLLQPPPNTPDAADYEIGLVLGSGAFSITYLACDTGDGKLVAIKEFLPQELAGRAPNSLVVRAHSTKTLDYFNHGLERFRNECQVLKQFEHPSIVEAITWFPANDTAYLVMTYYPAETLEDYVDKRGPLEPLAATDIMIAILDGLTYIHKITVNGKRWTHRDVKPDNILLRSHAGPLLIDFGAARIEAVDEKRQLSILWAPGYGPYEQSVANNLNDGPWVDIYACAATLYFALTGVKPVDARIRHDALTGGQSDPLPTPKQLDGRIPTSISNAVMAGLRDDFRRRPPDGAAYRSVLLEAREAAEAGVEQEELSSDTQVLFYSDGKALAPEFVHGSSVPPAPNRFRTAAFALAPIAAVLAVTSIGLGAGLARKSAELEDLRTSTDQQITQLTKQRDDAAKVANLSADDRVVALRDAAGKAKAATQAAAKQMEAEGQAAQAEQAREQAQTEANAIRDARSAEIAERDAVAARRGRVADFVAGRSIHEFSYAHSAGLVSNFSLKVRPGTSNVTVSGVSFQINLTGEDSDSDQAGAIKTENSFSAHFTIKNNVSGKQAISSDQCCWPVKPGTTYVIDDVTIADKLPCDTDDIIAGRCQVALYIGGTKQTSRRGGYVVMAIQ